MLNDESLIELIGSIGAQGYFPGEPLLVTATEDRNEQFVVVEGNRRLAAVKLLLDPSLAPVRQQTVEKLSQESGFKPEALPVIAFDTRDEILDYLGYRHVTGVKEWDPLAKARYLKQLVERSESCGESLTNQQLARRIGSRADYVGRLLEGLTVYEHIADKDFYSLEGVNEDSISFAVLTTALSYENIAGFVGTGEDPETGEEPGELKDENLRDVIDWMFRQSENGRTTLGESRNLGQLAEVVRYPEARTALNDGSPLADALLLTDEPLLSFRKAIQQATDKTKIARSMTHRIVTPGEQDLKILSDLVSMVRDLISIIKGKLEPGASEI